MPRVLLSVPPDPAFVRVTRLVASAVARMAGIGEDVLDDVRLAVGQACARAVSVHRDQGLPDPVLISFADDGSVEIVVHDKVALAPAEGEQAAAVLSAATATSQPWPGPDPMEPLATGVRELALLKALTGDLELTTGPDGSAVRMRWARPAS